MTQAHRSRLGAGLGPSLLVLALTLLAPAGAGAATGGPDAFGYTWRDGAEPGITYAWLTPGPAALDVTVLGDDTTTGFRPLSFGFPFYGTSYAQVAICSNGWLSFTDDVSVSFTNLALPTVGEPRGLVAAFWDDLELTNRRSRVTLEDLGTRAIVTWEGAHDRGDPAAVNDFQVILHDDGRIVVQLDRLDGDTTSSSLGIENAAESVGLEVFRNLPGGLVPPYVVEILPPATVPADLDCASALPLACNGSASGDLTAGAANQDAYACAPEVLDGAEQVWTLDVAGPRSVRLVLDDPGGQATVVVLDGCDPSLCLGSGDIVEIADADGQLVVVVDAPAGGEGPYELHADCFPVPTRLDCAGATPLACGETLSGDLTAGSANQDRYWCTSDDLSGREDVYRLDLATPTTVRIDLTPLSGRPRLLALRPCDANFCNVPVGDSLHLEEETGTWTIVVDSAPGDEGAYQLSTTCLGTTFDFCGAETYESQIGVDDNGSWAVLGLLYDVQDTHSWALRVDGGVVTYSQDENCTQFPFISAGTIEPNGPGLVTWRAPEGRLDLTVAETDVAGCCGLVVTAEVTNTDDVPHWYDLRVLHDLAFGLGDGTCTTDVVNGGPVDVGTTRLTREAELLPLGAGSCEGQVRVYSAEDPATLRGSFEVIPPTRPSDMELVSWESAAFPCEAWSDTGTNANVASCVGDSALLFTWRLPGSAGMLAPGEVATARWRLGLGCEFSCDVPCELPVQPGPGTVTDDDGCAPGLTLTWPEATFPSWGDGVYHVFRSDVSHVDALTRPPVTPPGGVTANSWTDTTAPVGVDVFHVVMAESVNFPDCGVGPLVDGSTDTLELGPARDVAAVAPVLADATGTDVEPCAADVRLDWTAASFPGAAGGVYHVYRSTVSFADARAQPALTPAGGTTALTWSDPAPPANVPLFYVVQAESFESPGCGDGPVVAGLTDEVDVGSLVDAVSGDVAAGAAWVLDESPCSAGIVVSWDAASFPGPGAGRHHVYRSAISAADALGQPPLTPLAGVATTTWLDDTVPLGVPHFYVVVAESTDFPGCGDGPSLGGPSEVVDAGSAADASDSVAPTTEVGALLRLAEGTAGSVRLDWTGAAVPLAGEAWVVLRSDAAPGGPFASVASGIGPDWLDSDAARTGPRPHCFYYDVRVEDACQNTSMD